ncbi:MAG TPA: hypothetical protein VMB76_11650 [Casimicrobiaceae bacterium]|jgi:hypothetical protein|nr:hypothetical protein [Casimicrobiaceae bacterium]
MTTKVTISPLSEEFAMPASSRDRSNPNGAPIAAPDSRRRRFLFALGVSGAGAAAASAASTVSATVAPAETPPADDKSGYRVTDHVRDYYDSARH